MRIQLGAELFDAEKVDPGDLLQLILSCRRPSPHFVALNPVWNQKIDSPISRWLDLWPKSVQKTLRLILSDTTESIRRGRALTIVVQAEYSDWEPPPGKGLRLNVKDALAMVRMPLHVLVENRRNDGRFIARFAIMLKANEDRVLFNRALCDGWFVFQQGGGLPEVQHLLNDLDPPNNDPVLCPNGSQRDVRRWRLFVVTDRDARAVKRPKNIAKKDWKEKPRDASQPSEESEMALLVANEALHEWDGRPAIHQLRRRAIENYIPLDALAKWSREIEERDKRERRIAQCEALRALDTADAHGRRPRWYFNMKDGLDGDKPKDVPTATADDDIHPMFHVLIANQRVALQPGFNTRDEKIAELLFNRETTPDDCLRDELSLDADEATNLLHNLLNRL
ncbi:MAG TPA: hypothetical protein PK156_23440 [Polyangium sp.]|nr:hypothetical protein [Polyangium sp.]